MSETIRLVQRGEGPYCDSTQHGRERFSHPAWLGAVGKQVLDWAWEDRDCVRPAWTLEANTQAARTKWYSRLLSPEMKGATKEWKYGLDGSAAQALEGVYLGAIEGWHRAQEEAAAEAKSA